mmetsp:Transcript_28242/g.43448  ORF Transcript_28242/g.43448 Transcript_28242/m.43448 type:complete len:99 (+) Transcript_28242:147-443(+)
MCQQVRELTFPDDDVNNNYNLVETQCPTQETCGAGNIIPRKINSFTDKTTHKEIHCCLGWSGRCIKVSDPPTKRVATSNSASGSSTTRCLCSLLIEIQ